jgi:hypothetical protein
MRFGIRPADVAGVNEQVVERDQALKVVGLRIGRSENRNRPYTGLKRAVTQEAINIATLALIYPVLMIGCEP